MGRPGSSYQPEQTLAVPEESQGGHRRWYKCNCFVPMTKIRKVHAVQKTIPLLRQRMGHRLAVCVWMHDALEHVFKAVFDVASISPTILRAGVIRMAVKTGLDVSRSVRRMEDVPPR